MRSLAFALVVLLGVATLGFCATLQRGDSSTDVQALQFLLIQAGYRITADGDFGPGTETAVKNFQSSRGLSATGVAYDSTLEKLYVTVQYGSTLRDAVKAVQVFLIDKFEYLDGGIDGSFGPATTAAAKEFQQDQGLTADGIVGPNTFKKFFNPGTGPVSTPPSSGSTGQYAQMIRGLAGVKLYDIHTDQSASAKASAHYTQSTPKYVLQDAANGITPWTSCYGTAPCRQQTLSVTMLRNLYEIGNTYDMWVTEIIGGSHSGSSKHYSGVAFDVNWFDGEKINMSSGKSAGLRLKQICKDRGATLALGPGDAGHDTHVHCEWKGAA